MKPELAGMELRIAEVWFTFIAFINQTYCYHNPEAIAAISDFWINCRQINLINESKFISGNELLMN